MMAFQVRMMGIQRQKDSADAITQKADGEKFLADNKGKDGVKTTASGIQYKVITEGTGPRPKATSQVTVHYRGTLLDGKPFDSSYDRGQPATFALNQVIPGWTEGVQLMNVGSKYQFWIPSDLAYGAALASFALERGLNRVALLYVNDVAKRIGLASDTQVRERIDGAIARVLEMQDSSGAFGIWGPSDGDMWLSSYVTDFLTRAKESGFAVRQQPFTQALDRLQNYVSYAQDFSSGGEARAYALYVLARNGRAPIGELRYYVDTKLDDFTTPLAQAQLGAALAMMGDKVRAEHALTAAMKSIEATDDGFTRRDYGTSVRDGAALITLAAETGIARPEVPRLIAVVGKAYAAKTYTSTQEQAWMVLAARSLADEAKSMTLTVNGQAHQGQLVRGLTAADLQGGSVTIANTGGEGPMGVASNGLPRPNVTPCP